MNASTIARMSRVEKLRAMEALWRDLSQDDVSLKSPAWHGDALRATEKLVEEGKASFSDWGEAKARIQRTVSRRR